MRSGARVEALQVEVDLVQQARVALSIEQVDDIAFEAQGGREVGVLADLALQACGVEFQAMPPGGLQIGHAQMLADPIGRIRRSQCQ